MMKFLVLFFILYAPSWALDNGLARTPPMGWLSWERFRCNTDCKNDPTNCISENLFYTMADLMVNLGFKDAGYEYIIIDDCWLDKTRDEHGNLRPDPERFPSGIKALADYVHNLGLKFGIYEDYGTKTCGGYPGIIGHMEADANTFASWGVDYVKLDGCYSNTSTYSKGYPEFGKYLNKTGRPMVYSCSWPAYLQAEKKSIPYPDIAEHCNLWRNYNDIDDSFHDVVDISTFYGDNQNQLIPVAGPGHWNDPDMLIIGDFSLSIDQSKYQMALWAIMASPLIMSADLRSLRPEFKDILLNRNVIKVNQDPLGIQGKRIIHNDKTYNKYVDVWVKPIMPMYNKNVSAAVAVTYRGTYGTPIKVSFNPKRLGLKYVGGYIVSDVFTGKPLGTYSMDQSLTISVNPTGVVLLRFDVKPLKNHHFTEFERNAYEAMKSAPDYFEVETIKGAQGNRRRHS